MRSGRRSMREAVPGGVGRGGEFEGGGEKVFVFLLDFVISSGLDIRFSWRLFLSAVGALVYFRSSCGDRYFITRLAGNCFFSSLSIRSIWNKSYR